MNNIVYVLDDKIILLGLWFCFDFSTFRMYFDYKRYEYFGFEKIGMRNLLSDKIDIENLFSRRTNYEINIVFLFWVLTQSINVSSEQLVIRFDKMPHKSVRNFAYIG